MAYLKHEHSKKFQFEISVDETALIVEQKQCHTERFDYAQHKLSQSATLFF